MTQIERDCWWQIARAAYYAGFKSVAEYIRIARLSGHRHPEDSNYCWLGFGERGRCPNMCKGECGYRPQTIMDLPGFRYAGRDWAQRKDLLTLGLERQRRASRVEPRFPSPYKWR